MNTTFNIDIRFIYVQIYNVIDDYIKEYNKDLLLKPITSNADLPYCFNVYLDSNKDKYIKVQINLKENNILNIKITTQTEIYTKEISEDKIHYTAISGIIINWFKTILLESLYNIL